jgi:phosphoenolpyruvate---glycerone phosphotransferase subunit DhaM
MVGIVLVSHSAQLASGLASLIGQVAGPEVAIEAAGGAPDGGLGTSSELVSTAIQRADRGDGVVILGDLGSAFLTVQAVLEDLHDGVPGRIRLVDAPLVEGAVAAAVTASAGASLDEVIQAAEEARGARKFS